MKQKQFLLRKSTRRKKFLLSALALSASAASQAQVAEALQEQAGEITQIGEIIVNIILAIFGAIALVQAIMVFIGSGTGEDKIKRSGTYIFMLVFVAIAYFMSQRLFN